MIRIDAAELALHEIAVAASKAPGDPKEVHEARLGGARHGPRRPSGTSTISIRPSSTPIAAGSPTATCRATGRCAERSSRPGPPRRATSAGWRRSIPAVPARRMRRLHGLRQCLPGHAPSSASRSRPPCSIRRSTTFAAASPIRSRAGAPARTTFAPTKKYARRAGAARASSRRSSGSSSTRCTARAVPSASRSAMRSATTRCEMVDKVPPERAAVASDGRALRPRHAVLPHRCRRPRPTIATRRRSPT